MGVGTLRRTFGGYFHPAWADLHRQVDSIEVGVESQLKAYALLTDDRLSTLIPDPNTRPEALHQAMRYSCLAPGKRLRPALCMASAEAIGATAASVLDAACALEMVHAFSLIHDDLPAIDDDDLRRGQPSCHKKFGEAIAILAGDALFALAYETLASSKHRGPAVVECLKILSKSAGSDGLVGGEVVDVESEGKQVNEQTLEFIHSRKTGSLISASCQIGAILGAGTDEQISALADFGRHVGLAFQIADDLLNELSTAEALGKAAGSDRARMKATYPAVYGIEATRAAASKSVESALAALKTLPKSENLAGLARFAIERLN